MAGGFSGPAPRVFNNGEAVGANGFPQDRSALVTGFLQVTLIEIVGDESTIQTHGGFYLIAHPHKPSLGDESVLLCPEPAFHAARAATSHAFSFVWWLGHKFEVNSGRHHGPGRSAQVRRSTHWSRRPGSKVVSEKIKALNPAREPPLRDQSFNVRTFAPGGGISCPADFMAVTCWTIFGVSPGWRSAV